MTYPPRYLRHTNFLSLLQAGGVFDQNFAAYLDAELNDIASSIDQEVSRWQAITTASAQLINNASALAMALAGSQRFVATAAQTVYLTTIPWDASFSSQTVIVNRIAVGSTQGGILDWNGLTVANNGGFLQATITSGPVIAAGDVILIDAFSPGAGVLASLASTANAKGASLVGIEDIAGYYVATTVEGALAEFRLAYNTFVSAVGATANLMKRDGTTAMTAALPMGGFKLTGLADGTAGTDAVSVAQLNAATQGVLALTQFFLRADVAVSWQSDQAANSHKLAGLVMTDTLGAVASEATNKTYVDGQIAAQIAPINAQLTALGNPSVVGKRLAVYDNASSVPVTVTWPVPAGITAVLIDLWGGGGSSTGAANSSGGGGAYTQVSLTLTPTTDTLSITVGNKGLSAGTAATDSYVLVNGVEVARAGAGVNNGAGGTGSVAINTKVSGGHSISGSKGFPVGDTGFSRAAGGSSPNGGHGSEDAGVTPGAGGGRSQNGGAGRVVITY